MEIMETAIEYLTTTSLGEKGQVTVPKQFRRALGLKAGAPVAVLRLGGGLLLVPEQRRFNDLCERLRSTLMSAGVTPEEAMATLPEARQRVFARHYGTKPAVRQRRSRSR